MYVMGTRFGAESGLQRALNLLGDYITVLAPIITAFTGENVANYQKLCSEQENIALDAVQYTLPIIRTPIRMSSASNQATMTLIQ